MMKTALLILLALPCQAAVNRFFGPSAAGSNNGTNCANAYAWNDATNGWSTSNSQPAGGGNVLHICSGTYNLTANAVAFQTVTAGTEASPNELIGDQGAFTIQASVLGPAVGAPTGAGFEFTQPHWIFDGGSNGTIQNTLNGAAGATCPGGACSEITFTSTLIQAIATCSDCTTRGDNLYIRNFVQIGPAYVRAGHSDGGNDSNVDISVQAPYVRVTQTSLTGAYNVLGTQGVSSNLEFDHNTITACGHCFTIGMCSGIGGCAPNAPTLNHVFVHDNHFHENLEYDSADDEYHVNAAIVFLDANDCSGCVITDLQWYNNLCDGTWSQHMFLNSCLFVDDQGSTNSVTWASYNNVYNIGDGAFGGPSGAESVAQQQTAGSTNTYFLNNTVLGVSDGGTCFHADNAKSNFFENNILDNCGNHYVDCLGLMCSAGVNSQTGTRDRNVWFGPSVGSGSGWVVGSNCGGGTGCGFSGSPSWQTLYSQNWDQHGLYGDPQVNTSTFLLASTSIARGMAANLTSLCGSNPTGGFTPFAALCQGAPQTFGSGGTCGGGCIARPPTGLWDAGAYPFTTAAFFTPTSLGPWTNTQVINQQFTASGFGTVTWSVISGALCSGLSLGPSSGSITGTIGATGTCTFTVQATDGTNTVQNPFTVTVNAAPLVTSSSPLPAATQGSAYSTTITTSGGTQNPGPNTCILGGGSTTDGLTLNTNCTITGTAGTAQVLTFNVIAVDSNNVNSATKPLSLTINSSTPLGGTTVGGKTVLGGKTVKF